MSRTIAILALGALILPATAQFSSSKVSLYVNWTPSALGGSSGNSCWGYTTPSGREYALMGINNKLAFIEVTNPISPVLRTSVAHISSSWMDVKVYGRYAYVVTEASGSGIQVIDMANLDTNPASVTLVRTISAPGRSHTIFVDTTSGYLYTCGSRENSGWTTVWTLADPSNPVRVGPTSISGTDYIHECQVKTYTSGPYAGRQLLFGCGTNRGLEIYDVTNKNATFLLKRVTYPGVAYCHQGWLSEDLKYFYVDDELDEQNLGSVQKTFIFDVSDPANAFLVGNFTRNEGNIDHNLYIKNGFIFETNYTRGLRIYDASDSPTSPAFVGFFDTYPDSNGTTFNGSWSNYPYFTGNKVMISDIDRGFFLVDVSQAVMRLNVIGSVNLEDFVGDPAGQVMQVQIRASGQPAINKSVTLGAGGAYSFTLNNTLTNAPVTVTFQGSHWLRKATGITLGLTGYNGLNVSLHNGDVDGDNGVDIADFAILSGNFGMTTPLGDLDGDGEVAIGDYAILSSNFGVNGDN